MKMVKLLQVLVLAVAITLSATATVSGRRAVVGAVHVVGGDRGWDSSSDLSSWSSARTFRVGDQIWISYTTAQGIIMELQSKEEYDSCDVTNPIKMYTNGLDSIPLEREGIRYFVSSEPENCNKGLKLHVEVMPMNNTNPSVIANTKLEAEGPSSSASSPYSTFSTSILILTIWVSIMMKNV